MIKESIIKSLLDNDLYTFGVGQLVHSEFPDAVVSYTFINRSRTKFPSNFVEELKNQLDLLSRIQFDDTELNWLFYLPFMVNKSYARFLSNYSFDPNELEITNEDGNLVIKINGKWSRTIMWEVPLLALISELYYLLTGDSIADDWAERIIEKGNALEAAGCTWMDFGTRRRYSLTVQASVVANMKMNKGFIGTSNCYLAYLYNVNPIGTMSHQFIMGISGLFGVKDANSIAMRIWKEFYGNDLSVFLPDTFTTDSFLKGFNAEIANGYEGLRQDSGDPHIWMDNKVIPHYEKIGVSLKDKRIIFSDSLNAYLAIELFEKYKDVAKISFGIGTNFSNDVGVKALSMVIKLNSINGVDIVKLSDVDGKYTGKPEAIAAAKKELGII
jgi:nicotinate phosphoribosyltransferase